MNTPSDNGSSIKYRVILSRPHGGSEYYQFNTRTEAEGFINRIKSMGRDYHIKFQFPFRTLFAKELDKLKKIAYFSS